MPLRLWDSRINLDSSLFWPRATVTRRRHSRTYDRLFRNAACEKGIGDDRTEKGGERGIQASRSFTMDLIKKHNLAGRG